MRAVLIATTLVFGSAGCASAHSDAPASQSAAPHDSSFPSLREVPRGTIANTDPNHWAEVEADVKAAGEALRASPRVQPVTAADNPQIFLNNAQQDLEQSRQAHSPN